MSKKSAGLFCALALSFATVAYAQTDATLTASVTTKLAADEMVKASALHVSTTDHVVTLSGAVPSKAARNRILCIFISRWRRRLGSASRSGRAS